MRSVVVVLPASMWAMMPMLRQRASGTCLAMIVRNSLYLERLLEPVVRERLVGFGHAMHVFALLHRAATQVGGIHEFVGQLLLHRLAIAAVGGNAGQPAQREGQAAGRVDLDGHLIVGTADAP